MKHDPIFESTFMRPVPVLTESVERKIKTLVQVKFAFYSIDAQPGLLAS